MRKWKRVLSILLMGAMLAGNVFVAAPETVRAEETAANRKGFIECKLADSDGRATYLGSWGGNVGDVCNITWTGPEANQEWEFREINTGVYTLVKVDSQKVLTALEDFTVGQRDLIENAASQQWIFVEDGEGYYRIKNVGTGLYLTTKRMAPQNDGMGQEKEIILTESAKSDSQLWKPALSGHIVSGVSWNGNKLYAAVDTGIPDVGQRIITWTGPEDNQKMIFRKIDETEYYQILNFDSNGKLALQAKDDGEIVLENSDETNQYQQWGFEEVDNTGTYRIKNAGNKQYFTTPRKETSADRYSVVRTEELEMGSASQLWTLEGALVVHPEVKVTGITITSAMEVTVGQTLALTATVEPTNATNPAVVWSIQGETDVLTLDGSTLTAVKPGTATVVATAADGSGVTASAVITVNPVMANVTVAVDDNMGSVTGAGAYAVGTGVTLQATAKEGYQFVGWYEGETLVSEESSYTFVLKNDIALKAVYKECIHAYEIGICKICGAAQEIKVTFLGRTGHLMNEYSCKVNLEDATQIFIPTAPLADGYTFVGWTLNGEFYKDNTEVQKAIQEMLIQCKDIQIQANYEKWTDEYTVTVEAGTLEDKTTSKTYEASDIVKVIANTAETGYKFSHWEKNGVTVSYKSVYTFPMPSENVTMKAVYVEDTVVVDVKGTAYIESVKPDLSAQKISFVSICSVPNDCRIISAGLVATSDENKADNLSEDNADYVKKKATTAKNYKYTWTKTKVTAEQVWYVKSYLVYEDADGEQITVYGDLVKADLNGVKE